MKLKNKILLGLTAATMMVAPPESAARVYKGTLEGLVESLKPHGVEIIDPSFTLDPSMVFMQLYTDGAITADGRVIDKEKSNVGVALAKGGLNPEQIHFALRHFSDLALINTGMNSALITGGLKKQIADRGLDQRILYAGHPDSLIAAGIMPLTTAQANAVYGLFYAGINREASSLGEFERTAEVSVPVIANSGVFQGQAYNLLSLLAFRPFDAGGLKHQMIDKLGVYDYVMNSWEEARQQGHIVMGKGNKVRVRLERNGQGGTMQFCVVDRNGSPAYEAVRYLIPLDKAWQQAGGRPLGEYANLAELVDRYVAHVSAAREDTSSTTRDVGDVASALPPESPRQSVLQIPLKEVKDGTQKEVLQPEMQLPQKDAPLVDLDLGYCSLWSPQAGFTFWPGRGLRGLSASFGFGGTLDRSSGYQEVAQQGNLRVVRDYQITSSPSVLEVTLGPSFRVGNAHVVVQGGVIRLQGAERIRVGESLMDVQSGALKGRGQTETSRIATHYYPDVRLGVGYRVGHLNGWPVSASVFGGKHNRYYAGLGVKVGVLR